MLKNLLREPLLHFLLIGAALFLIYSLQNDDVPDDDSNRIVVTEAHIDRLIAMWEKQRQRLPTPEELDGLIEHQVREEVLYREALAMGLDKNDAGVRRRLSRKVEFLFNDIANLVEPTETELADYLAANPEKFEIPGRISFVHVYFNADKRGDQVKHDAGQLLAEYTQSGSDVNFELAGDGFMLGHQHEDLAQSEVERLFGVDFTQQLFALPAGSWQGPVSSSYGVHLVRIDSKTPSVQPELDAVRDKVRLEWESERRRKMDDAFYQNLRKQYEIVVETGTEEQE